MSLTCVKARASATAYTGRIMDPPPTPDLLQGAPTAAQEAAPAGADGALVPVAAHAVVPVRSAAPLGPSPGGRRWRHWLLSGAVLLAIAAGAWYFAGRPPLVAVVTPTLGPAIEAVYATGIVEAIDTARVGTTVAGRVVAVLVWEGDVVRQGQPLAQLDDREARQALEDARARLALAEQELARDRVLVATGVHTVQALQRSVAERDRASAAVELAARQVDDRRIVAPLDGIVMRREVDPGNTAAAATALFTVASTARLRIAADVDERDIAAVRMGARVAIRADAYPNEAFTAVVTNIRRQGDTATRTFRVEADLPPPTRLFIGMTVDVNIVVAERPDALLLPPGALRHDPPQGGRPGPAYVFRVQDDLARRVPVETGAEGAAAVEIRSGVARNDQVIADPPENLADGARVRLRH